MTSSLDRSYGVIESPHMIATMLYIADHDGCRKIDVYQDVSHNSTMSRKIDMLEEAGLIVQRSVNRGIVINITDKGRAVAERLKDIEGILDGTSSIPARSPLQPFSHFLSCLGMREVFAGLHPFRCRAGPR